MSAESERPLVLVCYVLHLIGAVTGLLSIVALVLNYLKTTEAAPLLGSHHRWMIRSFWWCVLWFIVGALTWWLLFLGWLIWCAAWLWYVYRHVRGLVRLANGEPMPV